WRRARAGTGSAGVQNPPRWRGFRRLDPCCGHQMRRQRNCVVHPLCVGEQRNIVAEHRPEWQDVAMSTSAVSRNEKADGLDPGDPAALLARTQDLSRRLHEREEFYRSILESLGEGVVITDRESRILYVNSRMECLTGYPVANSSAPSVTNCSL